MGGITRSILALSAGVMAVCGPASASAQACPGPCPQGHACQMGQCAPVCFGGCGPGRACIAPGVCGVATPAAQPATAACFPECREGFVCHQSQCISACNPACGTGERCTATGTCVADAQSQPARDRQADGGATVSFGVEPAYTFVYYDARTPEYAGAPYDAIAVTAHMVSLLGSIELQYGFSQNVYLGLRVAGGRILNSDDSSGSATRFVLGPTLLIRPARPIYFGIDVLLQIVSFDDVSGHVHDYGAGLDRTYEPEVDGELLMGLAFGFRLGFVIEIDDMIAITPELRLDTQPITLLAEGNDVFFTQGNGGTINVTEVSTAITASAGFLLAARIFF